MRQPPSSGDLDPHPRNDAPPTPPKNPIGPAYHTLKCEEPEKLPYGNRIGMDLMCAPLVSGFETPATLKSDDYPLVIFSPDWNIDSNVNIQMLEDLGCAQLDDERRRELLTRFACMLVDYLHSHSTAEALVRAYVAGEYRSSFLRKELQWAFEREVVRLGLGNKGATSSCP